MTDVEQIKSKIDIVGFISDYIQVKRSGRNFKALCPFHGEKTPSFYISPERQSWHCFGACNEGGDAISFLQKWENIDFLEALKILAKKAGVVLSASFAPTDESREKDKLYEINHLASEFYHYLLTSHQTGAKALEYLASRNVKKEIIETFCLGYAPDSWESLLKFLVRKGYDKNDIFISGLLVKSDSGRFYDRFRKRLIFTLKDNRGNIVGFSGRKLENEKGKDPSSGQSANRQDRQEAKYINTPETPIYHKGETLYGLDIVKEAIKREKEAIIVEGEFDFLASFQTGVSNVVAIKGSALTREQILLLRRFTDSLCLALDSDFAGNEAAKRGIEAAEEVGLAVKVARIPLGKDPAECIQREPHLWKKAIKEAVPVYDFIIENSLNKYDTNDSIGKKNIAQEVVPFLAKITNPIVASHYVKDLSRRMGVSEESIEMAISQFQKKKEKSSFTVSTKTAVRREDTIEEYLLSLIIQSEHPLDNLSRVLKIFDINDLTQSAVKTIFERLVNYGKNNKKFIVEEFGKLLTAEISPAFDRAFLSDISLIISKKDVFPNEIALIARDIKKRSLRRRINDLSTKIRNNEENKITSDTSSLNEELKEILEKINALNKAS